MSHTDRLILQFWPSQDPALQLLNLLENPNASWLQDLRLLASPDTNLTDRSYATGFQNFRRALDSS